MLDLLTLFPVETPPWPPLLFSVFTATFFPESAAACGKNMKAVRRNAGTSKNTSQPILSDH
jgi:hypothetical protein